MGAVSTKSRLDSLNFLLLGGGGFIGSKVVRGSLEGAHPGQ